MGKGLMKAGPFLIQKMAVTGRFLKLPFLAREIFPYLNYIPFPLGTLFAVVSCLESSACFLGVFIFRHLYQPTSDVFPGFSFVIGAFLLIIPAVLVGYVKLAPCLVVFPPFKAPFCDLDSSWTAVPITILLWNFKYRTTTSSCKPALNFCCIDIILRLNNIL